MEILGHSSISLTMNTYSHVIPAMQEEVAAKMDGILTLHEEHPSEAAKQAESDAVATSMATGPVSRLVQ